LYETGQACINSREVLADTSKKYIKSIPPKNHDIQMSCIG